ncbi:glutamine amidotransferase-related protein [Desulfocapsa sulfexigens]|nr:gamma-glutamyl-gamma-aminobutyrate hydrolase family protein [Desulfocapsa sulfexigens]
MYEAMVTKAAHQIHLAAPLTIKKYFVIDEYFPDSPNDCDAWLVTCSHHDANEDNHWISRLKCFVLEIIEYRKPLAGICFGHQLISLVLGGKVARRNKWIAGVQKVHLRSNQFSSQPNIKLLSLHRDEVTVAPPNANVIASSSQVPIAMLSIPPNILTFQHHMEYTKRYLIALINSRKDLIGSEITQIALNGMSQDLDSSYAGRLLLKFLAQHRNLNQ